MPPSVCVESHKSDVCVNDQFLHCGSLSHCPVMSTCHHTHGSSPKSSSASRPNTSLTSVLIRHSSCLRLSSRRSHCLVLALLLVSPRISAGPPVIDRSYRSTHRRIVRSHHHHPKKKLRITSIIIVHGTVRPLTDRLPSALYR
jgi:hypothetical protein